MAEPTNSMAALMQILSLFQGKNQTEETSGQTTTRTTSQEGLNAMLKQALESNQGLASVMGGEKAAGLYNSSTNSLLSNDLTTRLAAQIAAQNQTTTTGPATKTTSSPAAINSKNAPMLAGVVGGGALYNELFGTAAKTALSKDGRSLMGKGYDKAADLITGAMAPGAEESMNILTQASNAPDISYNPGSVMQQFMPEQFDMSSAPAGMTATLDALMGNSSAATEATNAFLPTSGESSLDALSGLLSTDTAADVGSAVAPIAEEAGNFSQAAGTQLRTSSTGDSSAAAPSTVVNELTATPTESVIDSGALGGISAPDLSLSPDLSVDAIPASYGSDLVDMEIPLDQMDLGIEAADYTSAYNAADGSSAVTASDLGGAYTGIGSANSGSVLGYIGPIMQALNAQKNPDGAQGTDYRNAVGGAVLNYYGLGFLTPLANATATPLLDAAGDAGYKAMGNAGIVASDPVGALISGRLDFGDVITSGLDPGNILGGNEGGSVGGFIGATVDPVGTALGGEGLAGAVSEVTNSIDSAIAPGRVVCTELAFAGLLPMEKYREVIKPNITLTGRILLGYHVLGVPAVRRLRSNPKFAMRALPYVNAYLDHKLGKWNWRGFLIKSIGEPLCYLLSFVNTDPDYYKTLYPYRRNRNGT